MDPAIRNKLVSTLTNTALDLSTVDCNHSSKNLREMMLCSSSGAWCHSCDWTVENCDWTAKKCTLTDVRVSDLFSEEAHGREGSTDDPHSLLMQVWEQV